MSEGEFMIFTDGDPDKVMNMLFFPSPLENQHAFVNCQL